MALFDFSKHKELDTLAGIVPPEFTPFYAEQEVSGAKKFVLQLENPIVATAVKSLTGTYGALTAERTVTTQLREQMKGIDLAPLEQFGKSVEEIKSTVETRIAELSDQVAKGAKIDPVKLRQEFATAHAAELTSRDTTIGKLTGQFEDLLIDQQFTTLLAPLTKQPEFVLPLLKKSVKVGEDGGRAMLFVMDEAGNRRHNPATGAPMTAAEYVAEFSANPTNARLFDSQERQGPADPGNTRRPAAPHLAQKREDMSGSSLIGEGLRKGQLSQPNRQ